MAGNGNGNGNGQHEESLKDMPVLSVKEEEVVEANHNGRGGGRSVYTKTGNRRLSGQILSAPRTVEDAAAWTTLNLQNTDAIKKVHAILDAWQHCEDFNIECGLDEIRRYMILMPAAGGWGRALAAMIETGIIVPSGLGVGKTTEEEIQRAQKKSDEQKAKQQTTN